MGKGNKVKARPVAPDAVKSATAQVTAPLVNRIAEAFKALEAQRVYGDELERSVETLRLRADAESGVLNSNDPGQREASWQAAYKRFTAKSEINAVPGGLAYLYDIARNDVDPGQREAAWRKILEATTGGAQ